MIGAPAPWRPRLGGAKFRAAPDMGRRAIIRDDGAAVVVRLHSGARTVRRRNGKVTVSYFPVFVAFGLWRNGNVTLAYGAEVFDGAIAGARAMHYAASLSR